MGSLWMDRIYNIRDGMEIWIPAKNLCMDLWTSTRTSKNKEERKIMVTLLGFNRFAKA